MQILIHNYGDHFGVNYVFKFTGKKITMYDLCEKLEKYFGQIDVNSLRSTQYPEININTELHGLPYQSTRNILIFHIYCETLQEREKFIRYNNVINVESDDLISDFYLELKVALTKERCEKIREKWRINKITREKRKEKAKKTTEHIQKTQ
jgi:hypothetical protein